MSKSSVLILDDDELYRLELEMTLRQLDYSIWLSAGSSAEVMKKLENTPEIPDIMLLDVRLKENHDGIALAKRLVTRQIPFIYLTAYPEEEQFQQALNTTPSAYFIKPVKALELHRAIQVALRTLVATDKTQSIKPNGGDREDTLALKDKDNIVREIPINEVYAVESYGNFLLFHTRFNRFTLRNTLKEMECLLKPHGFFRIHRRYLISLRHWEKRLPLGKNVWVAGQQYPIGRAYRKDLQAWMEQ